MSCQPDAPDLRPNLEIDILGPARFPSPLQLSNLDGDCIANYTGDDERVLLDPSPEGAGGPSFELAGPRERLHFDGPYVTAGIVTCGGLCPGLNNVIRALVLALWRRYRVKRVLGFQYGYRGLLSDTPDPPATLTPDVVERIHHHGGTILGSSRGHQDPARMLEGLHERGVNILFCCGGDGTMRGAWALCEEIARREAPIAVVGLPKTIDNDLPFVERTFGFDTAVSVAVDAIRAARVEASGAPHGIGLVRLMGRHAGFVAAAATLASRDVDLVLVPELAFALDGERGVLPYLREILAERGEAVVVVAEGAGQEHLGSAGGVDASGNRRLEDIGTFLRDRIKADLADIGASLKYIDPSYIIRAAPANAADAVLCGRLAEDAVHAAMSGRTGVLVGLWADRTTHVPLREIVGRERRIDLDGAFWRSVIDCTKQPSLLA